MYQKEIRVAEKSDTDRYDFSVYRYKYKGKTVYLIDAFDKNASDQGTELYDDDCNFICSPHGTITGHGDGRCTDFDQEKIDEALIYEKK
ncbi:MAG: hypothetical protein K2X86_11275 [Cytophagaceae bacterium]|nr:hypothetical protein [Cytophagaceae bacterium]